MTLDPRSTWSVEVVNAFGQKKTVAFGADNGRVLCNSHESPFWLVGGTDEQEDKVLAAWTRAVQLARRQRAARPKPRGE